MIGRRFISFLRRNPLPSSGSSSAKVGVEEEAKPKAWGRRIVSGGLICVTGGVALSALDDLVIYHGCSSKAMEKASKNQAVIDAIGEPIARGPWYNASLAVTHKRHSVSCTFPVSGPQGTGIFQLRAVRSGESWLSFFRPRDWEILIMEALLHVPENEEKNRTFRIRISDDISPPACQPCITGCTRSQEPDIPEKTHAQTS
ncbi:uncharacterized protein LOC112517626 isoform X2 [Cynara cardunculus var. scolymus]|uniref:uncharacterized protein LOC112517626 isoform X2 n=1 Tax=Cynara cardunculus var. scolymus TaxID=59895 RepID=UPI000D62EFC2|nr:uncharacterized protein LOC112517626 isoform X2 [Cynara cardunculus var. scolymus]